MRKKAKAPSRSDDDEIGFHTPTSRKNKMGLELTPSGRPSVKKNQVNAKYGSNYSSSSSAEKILGKRLSIGRACALLGVVMLGPEIPLESAGHQDRMRIFKSAAHYCLSDEDLEDILDTKEAELEFYLQGIFRAACRLPRYELAAVARQHFELHVFKPASKNKEIQEHLGLEMGQSVFDKYDFWLFCIFMYVVLPLRRSGFLAFLIHSSALGQTRRPKRRQIM